MNGFGWIIIATGLGVGVAMIAFNLHPTPKRASATVMLQETSKRARP